MKVDWVIKDSKLLMGRVDTKVKHVHIRDVRDGWIMHVIGDHLATLNDKDIKFSTSRIQDPTADINYYINWTNNEPVLNQLPKTKCDMILFTHFEKEHFEEESAVIQWADLFTCMSEHGRDQLVARGVPYENIGVIEGFGLSTTLRRKVVIGGAGRPYPGLSRKACEVWERLAKDLNPEVFKFLFFDGKGEIDYVVKKMGSADIEVMCGQYDHFLNSLSYFLSPSIMEGGPMDLLNAMYAGVPVIARDIGFFHTIRTPEDYLFKDYQELLSFFKAIESNRLHKNEVMKPYTWDTFTRWHVKHFRRVFEI